VGGDPGAHVDGGFRGGMSWSRSAWEQIKGVTAGELIRALKRDGWSRDIVHGQAHVYIRNHSPRRRVSIHFHPQKTYGEKMLKHLLTDIGWSETDLQRLKLIR